MPRGMICRALRLWAMAIGALFIGVFPGLLLSQSIPLPQEAHSITGSPFTGLEETLDKAADTILASDFTQRGTAETSSARVAIQLTEARSRNDEGRVARTRLNLLLPAIEPILEQSGVPIALAAVVLVESGGRANALSSKGARGLWQLMPDTARRYGLRVDDAKDDRLDTEKSTRAASHYLRDLHMQFSSWTLALAAYNTGEQNVQRAISRSRSREFNDLSSSGLLPLETQNYVPRVLAAMQLFGQPLALAEDHRATNATIVFALSDR